MLLIGHLSHWEAMQQTWDIAIAAEVNVMIGWMDTNAGWHAA